MRPDAEGLSNTDGMREMIRAWTGIPEPVPLRGTGSDGLAASCLSARDDLLAIDGQPAAVKGRAGVAGVGEAAGHVHRVSAVQPPAVVDEREAAIDLRRRVVLRPVAERRGAGPPV